MITASSGGALELTVRWQESSPDITVRQGEAMRVFARTGTVAETATILDLTPARVYAIFGQVARRLGISAGLLREAVLDGSVDVSLCPGTDGGA